MSIRCDENHACCWSPEVRGVQTAACKWDPIAFLLTCAWAPSSKHGSRPQWLGPVALRVAESRPGHPVAGTAQDHTKQRGWALVPPLRRGSPTLQAWLPTAACPGQGQSGGPIEKENPLQTLNHDPVRHSSSGQSLGIHIIPYPPLKPNPLVHPIMRSTNILLAYNSEPSKGNTTKQTPSLAKT